MRICVNESPSVAGRNGNRFNHCRERSAMLHTEGVCHGAFAAETLTDAHKETLAKY